MRCIVHLLHAPLLLSWPQLGIMAVDAFQTFLKLFLVEGFHQDVKVAHHRGQLPRSGSSSKTSIDMCSTTFTSLRGPWDR